MRFLVDAQLPPRVAELLRKAGHDAVHTLELPAANRTTDRQILELVGAEDRVVVTKDADFVNSFVLRGSPRKLVLVSTGNIHNSELLALLSANLPLLVQSLTGSRFVEITRTSMVIRG